MPNYTCILLDFVRGFGSYVKGLPKTKQCNLVSVRSRCNCETALTCSIVDAQNRNLKSHSHGRTNYNMAGLITEIRVDVFLLTDFMHAFFTHVTACFLILILYFAAFENHLTNIFL